MPLWTPQERLSFAVDNWGTNPNTTFGTSVIPGASDAEGLWTASGLGILAQAIRGFHVHVHNGAVSAAAKPQLLDIGVDPAGGTNYTAVINNIVSGLSSGTTINSNAFGNGYKFYFPLRIPGGATVGFRVQGSNATAGTVRIAMRAWGFSDYPHLWPVGQYSETIGTITGSSGVSFTPGNAADGAWVSLGTTTRELWWWQTAYQVNNATVTSEQTYIELAVGDASNKVVIQKILHGGSASEACAQPTGVNLVDGYCRVPAGGELFIRGRCVNAPDTGYSAVAVGIGG